MTAQRLFINGLAALLLSTAYPGSMKGEGSTVPWSSFAAGAGTGSTAQSVLATSVGEPLAGGTSSPTTNLSGGFLGGSTLGQAGTTVTVEQSWNLISVPLTVADYARTILFPTATSEAFAYQGGYVSAPILANGPGYWLKFGSAQSIFLAGQARTQDSIAVAPGWNIIGSLSESVPVVTIQSVPPGLITTNFFGYSSGGYGVATSIDPGEGYWVKLSSAGMLVLSSSAFEPSKAIRIRPTAELPPAPPGGEASAGAEIPREFALDQNYPNPFNPTTEIRFQIPAGAFVRLTVFDVLGREVATPVNQEMNPGSYTIALDATNLASGVYIYRLNAGTFTATKRMMVVK